MNQSTPHTSGLPGAAPLTNAQAKPIAEEVFAELWREFHPMATLKVVANMDLILKRELKNERVRYQLRTTPLEPLN